MSTSLFPFPFPFSSASLPALTTINILIPSPLRSSCRPAFTVCRRSTTTERMDRVRGREPPVVDAPDAPDEYPNQHPNTAGHRDVWVTAELTMWWSALMPVSMTTRTGPGPAEDGEEEKYTEDEDEDEDEGRDGGRRRKGKSKDKGRGWIPWFLKGLG